MDPSETRRRLQDLLMAAGLTPLDGKTASQFENYISLFVRWNERLNLSAVRDEKGILSLHIIESIAVARELPENVRTLLDFGSGAGLPGIPIALCRPEIAVTLAESQGKKAAFLQEAVRVLGVRVQIQAGRAEALGGDFDCVILRAVDKMPKAVVAAVPLVAPTGWLALMTTTSDLEGLERAAGTDFLWPIVRQLPDSAHRVVAFGCRRSPALGSTESESRPR
jgi:16S rRNA (guanine527-N7)-methyltransferase